jgi:hypothetical protein
MRVKSPVLLVKRIQRFAGFRQAGDDGRGIAACARLELIVVESMERLADLEGDVVGDVYDVVDGALADQLQAKRSRRRRSPQSRMTPA